MKTVKCLAIAGGEPVRRKTFPQWPLVTEDMRKGLMAVLNSGDWSLNRGFKISAFEKAFAAAHQTKYCTAMTNGTQTLKVALLACGIKAGQEVIIPSWTFFSTAQAVIAANGVPVFADIDPRTLTMDPECVKELITRNTFGLIPVHFAGQPAEMDQLLSIAKPRDLVCIEDCAQAHNARYKGRYVGSIGTAGSFSFQMSKNMTAGEGGALTTNNDSIQDSIYSYYNLGRSRKHNVQYRHESAGTNCRMTEFQAVILLESLTHLDELTNKRNLNAAYLDSQLSAIEGLEVIPAVGDVVHGRHLYPFRFRKKMFDDIDKEIFVRAVEYEGIPISSGYMMGVHAQPVFQNLQFGPYTGYRISNPDLSYKDLDLPETKRAADEMCFLPQNVLLGNEEDIEDIIKAVKKVISCYS